MHAGNDRATGDLSLPVVQTDSTINPVVTAELGDVVLAAQDQRLRNRRAAARRWGFVEGKGTRRETDGKLEPATAEGDEPENAGRRETRGRRTKGKNPAGKRETGGKPQGKRRT